MIEPIRQGHALLEEIAQTTPLPGTLAVWWLGQSGFLIKSRRGILGVDLYLSEHLTKKYQDTVRPHVRMTGAPLRGHELPELDLVLASHKHSDHFDPETLPAILEETNAWLVIPEAIREHARNLGLPDRADRRARGRSDVRARRISRPRGGVGPRRARHRPGRASSLSGVRHRDGGLQGVP